MEISTTMPVAPYPTVAYDDHDGDEAKDAVFAAHRADQHAFRDVERDLGHLAARVERISADERREAERNHGEARREQEVQTRLLLEAVREEGKETRALVQSVVDRQTERELAAQGAVIRELQARLQLPPTK